MEYIIEEIVDAELELVPLELLLLLNMSLGNKKFRYAWRQSFESISRSNTDMVLDPGLQFLTVDDIAVALKLNKATIQRWIREGKLPAKRLGKEYRITRQAFIDWFSEYEYQEPEPAAM